MIDNEKLLAAIPLRHSVRRYESTPLSEDVLAVLRREVAECNSESGLNIQLVVDERRAFTGIFAYGSFAGVANYFVMAGAKGAVADEKIGYYGERLVLTAQTLGLNTCWAGLSYRKIKGAFHLAAGERVACMIALGYGQTPGVQHKMKTLEQVSNASAATPGWFTDGVRAALLAPSAINQQKFSFEYIAGSDGQLPQVRADKGFSAVGYTRIDLGIAKLHFELAAGKQHFEWI